jgi:Leucine-rich repeat (LRR) protein
LVICAALAAVTVGQYAWNDWRPKLSTSSSENPTNLGNAFLAESDRALAEWVLSLGGKVQIDNQVNEVHTLNELPKTPFHVSGINLDANPKVTDDDMIRFATSKRLRRLYLANTSLTDRIAPQLSKCENLEELFLHGSKVSGKGLAACRKMKKLKIFFASGDIDSGLNELRDCFELDFLSVAYSDVSDAGLADLKGLHKIESLELQGTLISDKGLVHLVNFKRLRNLELSTTLITDAGLDSLRELESIERLSIAQTRISDVGIAKLGELSKLKYLNLLKTAVTETAVKDLHHKLPHCRIDWDGGILDACTNLFQRSNDVAVPVGGSHLRNESSSGRPVAPVSALRQSSMGLVCQQ